MEAQAGQGVAVDVEARPIAGRHEAGLGQRWPSRILDRARHLEVDEHDPAVVVDQHVGPWRSPITMPRSWIEATARSTASHIPSAHAV